MKIEWVLVLCCLLQYGTAQTQANESRERDIRQSVERYDRAFNHKDAAAVERILAPNYVYFSSKGEVRSRQSLLDELLSPNYILRSGERTEWKIYGTSDAAVVSSRWKGEGTSGGQPFRDDQRCSVFLAREGRHAWLVLSEHCTQIVAP